MKEMEVEIPQEIIDKIPQPGNGIECAGESIDELSKILNQHYKNVMENERTTRLSGDKAEGIR